MKLKAILICLTYTLPIILIAQVPQTANLISFYPFNGSVNDMSGNNYNGTLYGDPTLSSDRFNNTNASYTLDGDGDYIYFGNESLSNFNYTDGYIKESYTISLWAKSSNSSDQAFVAFGENFGCCYYNMSSTLNGSIIKFNSNNRGFNINTSGKNYDGNWHQYVFVWDYSTFTRKLYIDGNIAGTNVQAGPVFRILNYGLSVGRAAFQSLDNPGDTYNGSLDDVRLWNVALNSTDVDNLYVYENNPENYSITLSNSEVKADVKISHDLISDILFIISTPHTTSMVYNLGGQKILTSTQKEIDLSSFPSGMYIVKVINHQNKPYTFKIIKK